MRTIVHILGNLLLTVSLGGLVLLGAGAVRESLPSAGPVAIPGAAGDTPPVAAPVSPGAGPEARPDTSPGDAISLGGGPDPGATPVSAAPAGDMPRPITKVSVPTIRLEAEVVPTARVAKEGAVTWAVPAHRAGHAEGTAGAGGPGNSVLVGHVSSRQGGQVFKDLHQARVGEEVQVFSGAERFAYRVVDVRTVERTDVSVVQPTERPSITLITCTGVWLPVLQDYTQRLVVRAELIGNAPLDAPTPRLRTLLDESRGPSPARWPHQPGATAWFTDGSYHLYASRPGRFVALGAPLTESLRDVIVTATFHKVGGPPGGGYGVVVRDQGPGPRDGLDQGGRYYVLEAGDRGEVGLWRREGDAWVDLLAWTPSQAVQQGGAANELTVRAIGDRLTFVVNGMTVASVVDPVLAAGTVGVFVGGDFNEVVLDRFTVQVPE